MKLNKKIIFTVFSVLIFSCSSVLAGEITNAAKLEYNKGIDYYNSARYSQAAESFKRATEIDPNYIDAYYNLGALLEYLNQDEGALAAFKQIILRNPEDYEAVYKAAEISNRLGASDKAKMYLTLIPQDTLIGQKAKSLSDSIAAKLPEVSDTEIEQPKETVYDNPPKEEISESSVSTASKDNNNPNGNIEVTNPEINSNGVYTDISSPTGIAADNLGNIYVAGFSDNTIYKILPDGSKIVYIKNNKIDGPIGIAIDRNESIYIANYNQNNVLKIEKNGLISEVVTDIKQPYCMYLKGNLLFVSSQGGNSVVRYKLYE